MNSLLTKKFRVVKMCTLAVVFATVGLCVYYLASAKPVCNCKFPNSGRYGVIGAGGTCRVVECEIKEPKKVPK